MKMFGYPAIFLILTIAVFPQAKSARKTLDPRIDKKHPTVYLSFERDGTIIDPSSSIKVERTWLRLHNNTQWMIRIDESGAEKGFGDASLYYDLLSGFEKVKEMNRCHVCSIKHLKPGRSILFSIPKEDLTTSYALRIPFSYGWENELDFASGGPEPTHYVYFYTSD